MADIQTTTWSEVAASNNAATPDGWPENQSYASVNDCAREMMGAIKREWNRSHLTISTGGTSTAITLTYTTAPTLVQGLELTAKITTTCGANATLNANATGARKIYVVQTGTPRQVVAGELLAGESVRFIYDTSLDGGSGGWIADALSITPRFPNSGTAQGQWTVISTTSGGTATLPAGGRWAYFLIGFNAASGATNFEAAVGTGDGGTALISSPGVVFIGFCWRIA